jgi:hypothetical protein
MEMEIAELASTTPFFVLNAIGFLSLGAAAMVACMRRGRQQRPVVATSPGTEAFLKTAA